MGDTETRMASIGYRDRDRERNKYRNIAKEKAENSPDAVMKRLFGITKGENPFRLAGQVAQGVNSGFFYSDGK